jgi:hypothetical protein
VQHQPAQKIKILHQYWAVQTQLSFEPGNILVIGCFGESIEAGSAVTNKSKKDTKEITTATPTA